MLDMKISNRKLINMFTVQGIPESSIDRLLQEAGRSREEFDKYMYGQTGGIIGGEFLYYPWDVERFLNRLKTLD